MPPTAELSEMLNDHASLSAFAALRQLKSDERHAAEAAFERIVNPLPHHHPSMRGKYNIRRGFEHFASQKRAHKPLDGLEGEVSRELSQRRGKPLNDFEYLIPTDAEFRDLTVFGAAGGIANIVRRPVIDALRQRAVLGRLGATFVNDLTGSTVTFPKRTATISLGWVPEGTALPSGNQTLGSGVFISPQTTGALSNVSRRLLHVMPDAIDLTINDMLLAIGVEIDRVGLVGSGLGNQPGGILQYGFIPVAAVVGTNGGALSHANLCSLEASIGNLNAEEGELAFLTSPGGRCKMRQTEVVTGTGRFLWRKDGRTSTGHRAETSTLIPANLPKGSGTNLTAGVLGYWPSLIIGTWGPISTLINPFTLGPESIQVVATVDMGSTCRHVESFAACVDMATAS